MQGVCLLSEISPLGTAHFNPLRQAADWYSLIETDEVFDLSDRQAFVDAIGLIQRRATERGLRLVIRDWSHLDWIGFPFVDSPPSNFSWDAIDDQAIEPNAQNAGEVGLRSRWLGSRCATVRHPVDQYLSMKRLGALKEAWDDAVVWRGMREFAEAIQGMPWFRYEDFLAAPSETLKAICDAVDVSYDGAWIDRWASYDKITGDTPSHRRTVIAPTERKALEPEFWKCAGDHPDFHATLDLLGYSTPEPLRRKIFASEMASIQCVSRKGTQRLAADRPIAARPNSLETGPNDGQHIKSVCASDKSFKDWDDEVVRWRQVIAEDPTNLEAHLRLAEALRWIGEVNEAADTLLSLARRNTPFSVDFERQLLPLVCDTLDKADRRFEGIEFRRRLAQLEPENKHNLFQVSLLLAGVGEVDESLAYCRRLLETDRQHLAAAANFLLYINYSDRYSAAEIANEHFRLGMRFTQRAEVLESGERRPSAKLRVGYLGSDFFTHPVGKIMLPILQSHDRDRLHVTVYHDGKKSDANTDSTRKAVDVFKNIHGWDDDHVFREIRSDELDVLIDIGGYTGGGNRLGVLSRRVAPVQASFLGYPNTSAIQTIDYHITDRFADPPGLTEHLYGEQLVWLDHAMLAWRPYKIAKDIIAEPHSGPVLGAFNNVAKISPKALKTYAAIMRRVPDARLIFKYGDRYGVPAMRDRYRREFAANGVLPDRIEFRTRAESLDDHLRTMASVDLALDAFPYQGTMTSLECLAVGTPIVSCCGDYYAHRATSAMMMRMGMHELVASDAEEYEEIAVQLLYDLDTLRQLRPQVKAMFYSGPLTDPSGLARELEEKMLGWTNR